MLAISPISNGDERGEVGNFLKPSPDEFLKEPMLEDIDFGDLFLGFDDGDVLPDLEVDPCEIFADFSFDSEENSGSVATAGELNCGDDEQKVLAPKAAGEKGEEEKSLSLGQDEEVVSATTSTKEENGFFAASVASSPSLKTSRGHKQLAKQAKSSQGKRKFKVDWTPELHRKFVQAVEQLGLDKAVPSRILELMGTDCLTRHNIASHLQKYRSHRKHLLAREAEAASWSQRRHMLASSGTAPASAPKRDMNPWLAPTLGFPPPPPPPPVIQPFRPLHVWGHPTIDPNFVPVWPKHLVSGRSPTPASWPSLPPPPHPSPWLHHYPRGPRDGWVANGLTQGSPCFPRSMPPTMMQRFPVLTVPGIPPHPLYRPESTVPPKNKQLGSQIQLLDDHPSKESIDATIGDVLAKPGLPLPLGLKPPSLESVMVELQKQGISKIPPTCS